MTYLPQNYVTSASSTIALQAAADAVNKIPAPNRLTDANATISMATNKYFVLPNSVLSTNRTLRISTTGLTSRDHIEIFSYDTSGHTLSIIEDATNRLLFKMVNKGSVTIWYDPENSKFEVIEATKKNGDNSLNLYDFGAVGDGITDDTQAVQNWINATPSNGDGVLDVMPGIYRTTKMIQVINNTWSRSLKIRGNYLNNMVIGNCYFLFDGDGPDNDSILLAKSTTTGIQNFSGAQLDGIIGVNNFSDPRRISVTMSGSLASFTNGATVTIYGTDMWDQITSENITLYKNISAPYLLISQPILTNDITLPFTYTSIKYFKNITQVTISAQTGTSGAISVGTAGATMFLIAGQSSFDAGYFNVNANNKAAIGLHFAMKQNPQDVATASARLSNMLVYGACSDIQGGQIVYGDETGAQVNEIWIDNCTLMGRSNLDSSYLSSGFKITTGNNTGDLIFKNCMFSFNMIGCNLRQGTAFLTSIRDCYATGNIETAFLILADSRANIDSGYGEGNKRFLITHQSVVHGGGVIVRNHSSTTFCSDKYVIVANSDLIIENCVIQNFSTAPVEWTDTKIISSNTCSYYASNNTWFVTDQYAKYPLYNINDISYFDDYYGVLVYNKNFEIFSDKLRPLTAPGSFIETGSIRHISEKYNAVRLLKSNEYNKPLYSSYPAIGRFMAPIVLTYSMVNGSEYGYNANSFWKSYAVMQPGTRLVGIYVNTTTGWTSSGASDVLLEIGASTDNVNTNNLIVSHSIKNPITKGIADADLGTAINRANAVQGGYIPTANFSTHWVISFKISVSGGGNTNTFTTGETRIQLLIEVPENAAWK